MGNEFINLELASTVVIDQLWHLFGQRWYGLVRVLSSMVTASNHTPTHTSVRPFVPPNAVPCQDRPVTSWKGRVDISFPAPATPMMQLYTNNIAM